MRRQLLIATAFAIGSVACAPEPQQEAAMDTQEEAATGPATDASLEAGTESTAQLADPGPDEHLLYRPDAIEWQGAPPSLEPGAQVAVLEGDPAERGVFTMRILMPDGYVIAPHWHPNVERVTVVSGTFLLGSGGMLDEEAVQRLEAGSYTSLPPRTQHYAIAQGETVIQLTSVGPWVINYVNEQDDPRLRSN